MPDRAGRADLDGDPLRLTSARLDLRRFERRDGEVLLRADVLGHRLIDVATRAWSGRPTSSWPGTQAAGCWPGWTPAAGRAGCSGCSDPDAAPEARASPGLAGIRAADRARRAARCCAARSAAIRRLKPAQIADLLEDASKDEETEILGQVHARPGTGSRRLRGTRRGPGHPAARRTHRRRDRRRAGPDARRRRRRRDRRAAAAAPAAGARPDAGRAAHQGADPDGLQPRPARAA